MRVVAGELRGRRLHGVGARSGGGTRPTTDRAREGLFGWLAERVDAAAVLDLFAGTGALGIEALSRGAAHVVFVERSRSVARVLRLNVEELGVGERSRVMVRDVREALASLRRERAGFDLVLADPPYAEDPERPGWGRWLLCGAQLEALLSARGWVVVERPRRNEPIAGGPGLALFESRVYGETRFDAYHRPGGEDE
ncbi:MAG: 16S rRNA (guanine(966)-N(2))-methyltransferase RsmD [Myxococcota bacterium]